MTSLFYIFVIITNDVPGTQVARASTAMVLNQLSRNMPVSTPHESRERIIILIWPVVETMIDDITEIWH